MPNLILLNRLLNEGRVRGVLYVDVFSLLTEMGCKVTGEPDGPWVNVKHPRLDSSLDLVDNGDSAMFGPNIDAVADYLRALLDGGYIDAQ